MQDLIHALSSVKRVAAVGLGGSRGLGIATADSDYDFVLFRHGGELISSAELINAIKPFVNAEEIHDNAGFISAQRAGRKIDIFQKDLDLIEQEIQMAKQGKFNWSIRQLFPHGDLSSCLISHIMYLDICHEKNRCLTNLRELAEPLPLLLMDVLVKTFQTQASITLIHAGKIRKQEDFQYLVALSSAFVFFSNIVLFAINKKYPVLERGGNRILRTFSLIPQNYEQRIGCILKAAAEGDLKSTIPEMTAIQNEISALVTHCLASLKTVRSAI